MLSNDQRIEKAAALVQRTLGPDGTALNWIPSLSTRRGTYTYSQLSAERRNEFCAVMARHSASIFGFAEKMDQKELYLFYQKLDYSKDDVISWLHRPLAKAKITRPLLHEILSSEFGVEPVKDKWDAGVWNFRTNVRGIEFCLSYRFLTMRGGIKLELKDPIGETRVRWIDSLCCFGGHNWDLVFEGEEREHISKISSYIRQTADFILEFKSIFEHGSEKVSIIC